MKQLVQYVNNGNLVVVDVPAPQASPGRVVVANACSLVSAGTERMIVDFAAKNLVDKARSRPDLVKQVWDKAQVEGILTTWEAARNRLEQPMALGYSSAGTVIEVGDGVTAFKIGDRVACAGGGFAVHAEVVSVPQILVTPLPPEVDFAAASFTTLGAIALQGIRLADVKLGETIAVIGLGLLGQLAVQMLKAAGCLVVAMDIQPGRAALAARLGADYVATSAEEMAGLCSRASGGKGADAVLITADTASNQPVELAGEIARDKGVVVAVGAVGLSIPRKVYYEKELAFHVSRSYGPGRYDPVYEVEGHDYPYAYVRWTEQRNMGAFVQLLAAGKVSTGDLITHRFPLTEAVKAYDVITGKTTKPFLAVVLTYPDTPDLARNVTVMASAATATPSPRLGKVTLGVLGAGNFANATLLPVLKQMDGLERKGIASGSGLSAQAAAQRFGFGFAATDVAEVIANPDINTVAILTRHHLHAPQVLASLAAGKHVFVEKPLCLTDEELETIIQAHEAAPASYLLVGFNRRFAPFMQPLKQHFAEVREPLLLTYRVNAGFLPADHWLHDPHQGGGRLLGEACHFIDLLIYLAGARVAQVQTHVLPDAGRFQHDNFVIALAFANGSCGQIVYAANGDKSFGKERIEVFGGGKVGVIDDFRHLSITGHGKRSSQTARLRSDKGHAAEWASLVSFLGGKGPEPMSFADIVHATRTTLAAQRSLVSGERVIVEPQPTEASS